MLNAAFGPYTIPAGKVSPAAGSKISSIAIGFSCAVAEIFATVPAQGRLDLIQLVQTRANGHPTVAAYLPGGWLPHCVLGSTRPAEAFAALHPVEPVRARIVGVEVAP